MSLHSLFAQRHNASHRASRPDALGRVIPAATKSGKGFGGSKKQDVQKPKHDGAPNDDKQMFKEATAAISSHRPVKPEEAARGKLDYVQVADWGDGDRGKLGDLRMVNHVQQYEGDGADGGGADGGGGRRPFHLQLAHQLKMAESRGALAVAGPPPPAVSEWSFRETRYEQYLADQLEVHTALETALSEATATTTTNPATPITPASSPGSSTNDAPGAEAHPASAAPPPVQGAVHALRHLAPGRLGLERSAAIRRDLVALRATVGHPAALEARRAAAGRDEATTAVAVAAGTAAGAAAEAANGAEGSAAGPGGSPESSGLVGLEAGAAGADGGGAGVVPSTSAAAAAVRESTARESTAGPMARSYAQVLRRLGRVAAGGETDQEREGACLRLLAHSAALYLVAQAAGARVGAGAVERLALMQRRAAAMYHEYPDEVTDPRVTIARALDAAGEHVRSPAARQVVYDEMAGAMQKTSLLLSALAHRD